MAHLHRLIFAALVLLTAWLPSTSYADFPATSVFVATRSGGGASSSGSTPLLACAAFDGYGVSNVDNGWIEAQTFTYGTATDGFCRRRGYTYDWQIATVVQATFTSALQCPSNSTLSGSLCTCAVGWSQSGSSCVDPNLDKCNAAKGGLDLFEGFSSLPTFGASFCPSNGEASSCAATVVGGYCAVKAGAKKCTYEVKYGGGTCTPPAPSPTESPVPTPCKGTYGQVNGVDVCLPLGSDPSVTVETGKRTETTTTPPGGGGSTTTTEEGTSTCIGSQCTTTTTKTTTGPDGVPSTTTETKSESKDDFCKNNPRSPQCITSSFGGSCAAAFTCDGDAVMCAITREQHVRNCKLFDDNASTEAQLYGSEKGKTGSQTGSLPDSQTIAISSSSFDTSDAIGGGSGCIADRSVTVAGSVVTIPFSSVCGHLAMLGNILLAVSFLLAGRIVVRG